jgi:hypothetical protein
MVARNTNVPFKGRIQKRKTYHLQIITFRLQRAAGPYRSATTGLMQCSERHSFDHLVGAGAQGSGGSGQIVGYVRTIEPLEGILIESGGRQVEHDTTAG